MKHEESVSNKASLLVLPDYAEREMKKSMSGTADMR